MAPENWKVEFFTDSTGREPIVKFLDGLPKVKRAAAMASLKHVLQKQGTNVCKSGHGKSLKGGLYELRIRRDEMTILHDAGADAKDATKGSGVLLRIFFCAYGDRVVLLLGGYDKGVDPSKKKQSKEIGRARRLLREFKAREARQKAARRRGLP